MIISRGEVQVRVSRIDHDTLAKEDYWMCNLRRGACINVYNCFQAKKASFFSFYVISDECHVDYISVTDLEKIKENCLDLNDTLKLLKHRIKQHQVNDLDYFPFPYYRQLDVF